MRGQSSVVLLVYIVVGSVVFNAMTPGLQAQIQIALPYVDNLTALILRFFIGLLFLTMVYGIYKSTLEPAQAGSYQ